MWDALSWSEVDMRIALFSCCLLALLVALFSCCLLALLVASTSAFGGLDLIVDAIRRSQGSQKKSLSDELIDNKELLKAYLLLKENELQVDADEDALADKLDKKTFGLFRPMLNKPKHH